MHLTIYIWNILLYSSTSVRHKMKTILIHSFYLSIFLVPARTQSRQEYYENLINTNIQNAVNYRLPVDNSKFYRNLDSRRIENYGTYDFIIIGAGSAGSVLATRLSEISCWKILLLEAGGEENDFTDIPAMIAYLQFNDVNWGYYTTPQKKCCLGMVNRQCNYPRGKVIGGSSTINALIYARGNRADYNNWARLGNTGWSYKEVLPYFKKSERSLINGDPGYHGENGPWTVAYREPKPDLLDPLSDGLSAAGIANLDYNGAHEIGYSRMQYNIKHGKRQSTGRAFLDGVRYNRKNLNVTINALVRKIIINKKDHNLAASGVEFIKDGHLYRAKAKREVILSGGSINSPQLMMLSGLGPKKHLKSMKIPVLKDLPAVGQNLQDHNIFYGLTVRTNTTVTDNDLGNQIREYLRGVGPLTDCGNNDIIGFQNTSDSSATVPDIEYIFVLPNSSAADIAQRQYNVGPELGDYFKSSNPMTDFKITSILLHPKSMGSVTLKSNDIRDYPNIDINSFTDEGDDDIDRVYKSVKYFVDLIDEGRFKSVNAEILPLNICGGFKPKSKKFWYCAIQHASATLYHPLGTNRMGQSSSDSVVNHELKVHGVKKLRIVDASIFPTSVSGHTNAPTIMSAEKISDAIKKEYGRK